MAGKVRTVISHTLLNAENQLSVVAARTTCGVGLLMRNIGNAAFGPTLIAALMFAFLSFTFAIAKVLTYLSGDPRLGSLLATWAAITVAAVVLLRQIPRLFER